MRSDGGRPCTVSNSVELDGTVTFGSSPSAVGPITFDRRAGGATTLKRDSRLVISNTTTWEQPFSGDHQVVKDGTGTLVLAGDTRVKEVIVEHGGLRVTGTLTCEKLEIKEGGTLSGPGRHPLPEHHQPRGGHQFRVQPHPQRQGNRGPGCTVPRITPAGRCSFLCTAPSGTRTITARAAPIWPICWACCWSCLSSIRVHFSTEAYQEGGIVKDGTPVSPDQWTYTFIQPVVDEMCRREGHTLPYYLVGHSAGAQFLNRMSAFLPGHPARIVAANPGSLIFPTRNQKYPYGFGGLPDSLSNDDAIKRYLAAPLTLYLGTDDVKSDYLPTDDAAMAQGATRIDRGRNCYAMAKKLAESRGWPFAWRIVEADGLGHGSLPMWKHKNAQDAVLGSSKPTR